MYHSNGGSCYTSIYSNNSDFLSTTRSREKKKKDGGRKFREVLSVKSAARTESDSGTGRRLDLEKMRQAGTDAP
jgi:hypothetical protein